MTSLRSALRKLSVRPGDVILVKDHTLTDQLCKIEIPQLAGTAIIEVDSLDDLRAISEERMNELGWYRK